MRVHKSRGGVDVRATGVVAQVKWQSTPVGRPPIQQLFGVATVEGALPIFFSFSGFTPPAVQWASQAGVALHWLGANKRLSRGGFVSSKPGARAHGIPALRRTLPPG
jgi:hypothetical protein